MARRFTKKPPAPPAPPPFVQAAVQKLTEAHSESILESIQRIGSSDGVCALWAQTEARSQGYHEGCDLTERALQTVLPLIFGQALQVDLLSLVRLARTALQKETGL